MSRADQLAEVLVAGESMGFEQGAPGADPTKAPGAPTTAVGARSTFVHPTRAPTGSASDSSFTPLQDFAGTITPSDLHFEVHHAGVPLIDPVRHSLLIHGLADRPTIL